VRLAGPETGMSLVRGIADVERSLGWTWRAGGGKKGRLQVPAGEWWHAQVSAFCRAEGPGVCQKARFQGFGGKVSPRE